MWFLWIGSLSIYVIRIIVYALIFIFSNGYSREFQLSIVEMFSFILFISLSAVIILSTVVIFMTDKGYYNFYKIKDKIVYLIMIILTLFEAVKYILFKTLNLCFIFSNRFITFVTLGMLLFILILGFSYIVCKKDYYKKLEMQKSGMLYKNIMVFKAALILGLILAGAEIIIAFLDFYNVIQI